MSITFGIRNWLNIAESNESLMIKYGDTGDVKFIKELVKRLEKDLYHYLYNQVGPDLSADLCQIAWEKVIKNRKSYSETGSVKSWLFKIARSAMVDELRRQQRWQFEDFDDNKNVISRADAQDSVIDNMSNNARQRAFEQAMEQLPFLQREAFILQQEGFRLREIAQITYCEVETIKSRLRYAKQSLITLINESREGE